MSEALFLLIGASPFVTFIAWAIWTDPTNRAIRRRKKADRQFARQWVKENR
jgi:hypothetical protein